MKNILIALSAILLLLSCSQSQEKEDDAMAAIGRYMAGIGANYTPGEHCIPYCLIAGTEEENPEDIRVWGDFLVDN